MSCHGVMEGTREAACMGPQRTPNAPLPPRKKARRRSDPRAAMPLISSAVLTATGNSPCAGGEGSLPPLASYA
jgi:hypothetical protein